MKPFTVKKLFSFLKQSAIALDTGIERFPEALLERNITGVSTDSRTIHGGEVFFAVRLKIRSVLSVKQLVITAQALKPLLLR